MIDKIANMRLEDYLDLAEIDCLDDHQILAIKIFIELKLANLENKFLKPVLTIDDDVISSVNKHNNLATGFWGWNTIKQSNKITEENE